MIQNIQITIDDWAYAACNLETGVCAISIHGGIIVIPMEWNDGDTKLSVAQKIITYIETFSKETVVGVMDSA